jgi:hypothetical protein
MPKATRKGGRMVGGQGGGGGRRREGGREGGRVHAPSRCGKDHHFSTTQPTRPLKDAITGRSASFADTAIAGLGIMRVWGRGVGLE